MRYRLRPVRPRQRARLRLTLATLLLPLLGVTLLARSDGARAPLAEREATLAIGLQKQRVARLPAERRGSAARSVTTLAVVSRMPRLAGNHELQLRLAGIAAGSLALGLLVRLGTRLFAPRVGIAVALLLLALPTGRRLLGLELGAEPFYLATMLAALLAMRSMADARIAAVFAGIASGLALAFSPLDALWLPVLALAWLRVHQGLGLRSAGVILGTTTLTAVLAVLAGWLLYGLPAGAPMLPLTTDSLVSLDAVLLRPAPAARELIPLLPLVLLGLWTMRSVWWQSESFRFLFLWLVFAAASWALSGSGVGAYVALLMLTAAVALLALEHARLLASLPACGVAVGLAVMLWQVASKPSDAQLIDRWAIREAGRFVGRVIDADRRIAASPRAARRFAYYGKRQVEPFAATDPTLDGTDYVIVSRTDLELLRSNDWGRQGASRAERLRPKRIAEFGNWVVVRLSEAGR